MMRRQSCLCVLTILILAVLSLIAPTSSAQPSPSLSNTRLEWPAPTVTAAGRVRVTITKTKPKIHLARQHRPVILLRLDDTDTDYYDELPNFQVGYRRPELVDQTAEVNDISDEIKIRLLLARKRALQAYHATWS
jgi:hypothetical protein